MPSIRLFAKKNKLKISHNSGGYDDLPEGSTTDPYDALNSQHVLDVKFSTFANSAEGVVKQTIFAGNEKPCLSVAKDGGKVKKLFIAHPKTRKNNANNSRTFKGVVRVRMTEDGIRYRLGKIDLKFKK